MAKRIALIIILASLASPASAVAAHRHHHRHHHRTHHARIHHAAIPAPPTPTPVPAPPVFDSTGGPDEGVVEEPPPGTPEGFSEEVPLTPEQQHENEELERELDEGGELVEGP